MAALGSVEDLAPTERVYAVRFMGERAYVVTFRQVDPLFVIDLTDPAAPTVLGQLKVVASILFSVSVFHNQISPLAAIGTCVTICGMALYARTKSWEA